MTDTPTTINHIPEHTAQLRAQHPTFRYEQLLITPTSGGLRLDYRFTIQPNLAFCPNIEIPLQDPARAAALCDDPTVRRLAFFIGMVELLSYWKLCCPPRIEIAAGHISDTETPFWDTLIRKGLGEFFFTNNISPDINFSIFSAGKQANPDEDVRSIHPSKPDSYLVLVGGGKDSIVTLELLRGLTKAAGASIIPFALNPIPASLEAIHAANYTGALVAKRTIDPKLRELNSKGYLNGHTPFSALIAFISTLTAYANGQHFILASNESSASEGNLDFHGMQINHQYSKSLEFEREFRRYISKLRVPVEYLSFLRPLNEIQICALFSTMTKQHAVFRSCNREQTLAARTRHTITATGIGSIKRQGWCADCPKCVFTFLCLRCFLTDQELQEIFGVPVEQQHHFLPLASALAGVSDHKPFECVGTYEEVRSCLSHLIKERTLTLPANEISTELQTHLLHAPPVELRSLLNRWNDQHFLNPSLESLLRNALEQFHQAATL